MKRRFAAAAALSLTFSLGFVHADAPLSGVYLAAPGSLSGAPFSSPDFLFADDPRAAVWNPAAGADRELPSFGVAAALAFPTSSGSGAGGYASFSASVPTAFGTGWAVVDGVMAAPDLPSWAVPSGTSLVAGLSKRLSERLAVGFGAGGALADADGRNWSLSASLGIELALPGFAPAGSELSASVVALGPTLDGGLDAAALMTATPILALRSRLVETPKFAVSASALIAAPLFTDLAAMAGASFSLGPNLSLDLGWRWSVARAGEWASEGTADQAFSFIPAVTLRFEGSSFLRLGDYGTTLAASARPSGAGSAVAELSTVFSRGERDVAGPELEVGAGNRAAYSPRLVDAVELPLLVRDASRIAEWKATVYGPDGEPVFSTGSDSSASASEGAVKALLSVKKGIAVPKTLAIPLSKTSPDGEYRVRASAKDEYGNEGRAAERVFVVDGTSPEGSAVIRGAKVFSPNGDGTRDFLTVEQEGTREERWTGTFRSADGKAVRVFVWTDGPPSAFSWDGRADSGEALGDGEYSYELASVDAAGNRGMARIASLRLDGAATPLSLSIDRRVISSDRDAAVTSLLLSIEAPRKRGLASWNIALIGEGAKSYRTWSGSIDRLDVPPSALRFDGRNAEGDALPDGRYRFRADFDYDNGNRPNAYSPVFTLDSKKPSGRLRVSASTFTLDGGRSLSFYQDLSPGAEWRGLVTDETGAIVRELPLGPGGESTAEWNGLNAEGLPVPPGRYRYAAEGTNGVGLVGRTAAVAFRVETGGKIAALIPDRTRFSAVSGEKRVRLLPRVERRDRIVSYEMSVRNASSQVVRRYDGIAALPAVLSWDGRDEYGAIAADGDYTASLSVQFEGGERAEAEAPPLSLDSTPPRASLSLNSTVFSPNKDGVLDEIVIEQKGAGTEVLWSASLIDDRDSVVRSFFWKGVPPERFVWDGRDAEGTLLPDARYRYRLSSIDAAGNEFAALTPAFVLDARVPTAAIAVDKKAFSPNGDGFADSLSARVLPSFSDGLSSWTVEILAADGSRIRVLAASQPSSSSVPPPPVGARWDGSAEGGATAPDGVYRVAAELRYAKGDVVRVESQSFRMDTTPPEVAAAFAPLPFSPDGDGVADELTVDIRARDASPLAGWILTITDPAGYPFTTFSGAVLPEKPFVWDGRDLEGDLVEAAQDYAYELIVRDELGNTRKTSGSIPVDVFVLRDGERLKIRISSIEFAPSSSSLSGGNAKAAEKNSMVLDRIAAVLARYPDYRVRVEGHAVNVSGMEREERTELAQLSAARARAVLEALAARGVDPARLAAKGLGGREPIVPHGDVAGRWRNRRVEFILVR